MNPRILLLFTMLAGWMNRNQQRVIEYLQEEIPGAEGASRKPSPQVHRPTAGEAGEEGEGARPGVAAAGRDAVTPQTILRWHRKLIARKYDGTGKRGLSRRALRMREVAELAIWMAQENSGWGYRRIQGGLKHLGLEVSHTTVYNILRRNGLDPSPKRGVESNWQRFIRAHMDVLGAMDFFTVEVWTLRGLVRYSVHFVMDVGTRRVLVTRIAPDWDGPIMENVARGLTDIEDGFMRKMRYAIMDNDSLDYQPG